MKIIVICNAKRKKQKIDILIFSLFVILSFLCMYNVSLMLQSKAQSKVVKIGVIDSLLEDKYLDKYDVVKNINLVKDTKVIDHGNTVLSIIKKDNDAKIYYASTLDSKLIGNISDVTKAIYWCVQNDVDIINMSFATTEDNKLLKEAIEYAQYNGVIIVASCMNYYNDYSYPAMYPGVMSVSDGSFNKARYILKKEIGTSSGSAYLTNEISKELKEKNN